MEIYNVFLLMCIFQKKNENVDILKCVITKSYHLQTFIHIMYSYVSDIYHFIAKFGKLG